MVKPTIVVEKVAGNPTRAVRRLFESFPDLPRRIGTCKKVFIKINAVYFHPHLHTSLSLIESVVQYMKTLDPRKQIYVMDNCSQGNFTRLCFATIGLNKIAKSLGVRCLYLDEEKPVSVVIENGDGKERATFPRILYDNLISSREGSFYLNMPVLKAHCQAQMTAGIKNQMGLLYDHEKAKNHNHRLHQKLVDILKFIKPDFTLVDALKVLARGPMPPARFVEGLLHEKDVIVGGEDIVAVDAVCAKILGHQPEAIKHVTLAAEQDLGVADLDRIEIKGDLPPCEEKIPWELATHFPENLRVVIGKGGSCYEGCLGHAEQVLELVVNENTTHDTFTDRPLTIVTGRDFEAAQLEALVEPIILLGECACKEAGETLRRKHRRVDVLDTCGRCDNILAAVTRNLGVDAFNLSPLTRLEIYRQFLSGKLHGLRYKIPR